MMNREKTIETLMIENTICGAIMGCSITALGFINWHVAKKYRELKAYKMDKLIKSGVEEQIHEAVYSNNLVPDDAKDRVYEAIHSLYKVAVAAASVDIVDNYLSLIKLYIDRITNDDEYDVEHIVTIINEFQEECRRRFRYQFSERNYEKWAHILEKARAEI